MGKNLEPNTAFGYEEYIAIEFPGKLSKITAFRNAFIHFLKIAFRNCIGMGRDGVRALIPL